MGAADFRAERTNERTTGVMRRVLTSRWSTDVLRRTARFGRIAAWPRTVGMRLLLRPSRLHRVRERLWSLTQVAPHLRVTVNVNNDLRFSSISTASAPVRVIHRSTTLRSRIRTVEWKSLPEQSARAGSSGLRAAAVRQLPSVSPLVARAARGFRQEAPLKSQAPDKATPLQSIVQRVRRADVVPAELPPRLLRQNNPVRIGSASRELRADDAPARNPGFPRRDHATSATTHPAPLAAPFNVEQLADQVVRQIDRRLIASRERMGRI